MRRKSRVQVQECLWEHTEVLYIITEGVFMQDYLATLFLGLKSVKASTIHLAVSTILYLNICPNLGPQPQGLEPVSE